MSTVAEIETAIESLPAEDFTRLMEDLRDVEAARAALAEIEAGQDEVFSWESVKAELDAPHGWHQRE